MSIVDLSRCGKAIVEPRFLGSLEGYIVVEPVDENSREVVVKVYLKNYGFERKSTVDLVICGEIIERRNIKLKSGDSLEIESSVKIKNECTAKLVVDGVTLDEEVIKLYPLISHTPQIVIVFHHHQPPNYGPDKRYVALWPFVYVWKPILSPYGFGPYHFHAVVLNRYRDLARITYNLSPSLLAQLNDAIENGITTTLNISIDKSLDVISMIKETIDMYKNLANTRTIEVLTSVYAHTIAGYVVDYLKLDKIIAKEIEYGFNITKQFLGRNPKGIWLPEMSFSMKLIHILSSLNLEYTFLDEKCHLNAVQEDIKNPYELYTIQDSLTGESLTIFFRDTELSNDIGFNNNYCSDIHAIKGAYVFASKLIDKAIRNKAKVVTLALDGENWMIGSRNPPATAVFFATLLEALIKAQKLGLIVLKLPEDVIKHTTPVRKLRFIPSTTWLCSYSKWRGEIKEHEIFWREVESRIEKFKNYITRYGYDEKIEKAEWALWHILDSDYWWAEFWNKEIITLWIKEFDKHLKS